MRLVRVVFFGFPLSLLGALAPAAGGAQGDGLSLFDAVQIAQRESFALKAARDGVEAGESSLRASGADRLPNLSVSTGISDYSGQVFFARFINPIDPGQPRSEGGQTDTGSFGKTIGAIVQLSQNLYTGGAIGARQDASRVGRRMAEQEVRSRRIQITFEVTRAYYDVLLGERSSDVARKVVGRAEQNLETITKRFDEGEALQVEVLAARSRLASDQQSLLEKENALDLARRALNRLLERDPGASLQLEAPLELVSVLDPNAPPSPTHLEHHPDVLKGRLSMELAESMMKAARAHTKPKLELQVFFAYLNNDIFFRGSYLGANLNVSVPFFRDAARGSGALGQARAQRSLEENALRELTSALTLQAEEASRRLVESYGAIRVADRDLQYYREKYRVTEASFGEHLATFDDLIESHTDLAEAELRLYQSHYRARLAAAERARLASEASPTEP